MSQTMPSFRSGIEIVLEYQGLQHTERYTYTGEVPKELMDAYQQIVGNGLAKVSVSADMGTKDFGKGVSASVFVSLTCDQNQATLQHAIELAGAMARWAARDQNLKGEAEYQKLVQEKQAAAGSPHFR